MGRALELSVTASVKALLHCQAHPTATCGGLILGKGGKALDVMGQRLVSITHSQADGGKTETAYLRELLPNGKGSTGPQGLGALKP